MSKKFVYDLGFKVDRRGLDEAIAALRQVQAAATEHQNSNKITEEMKAASASATQLIDILSKS